MVFGAAAVMVALASTAWACTKIEGTLTVTGLSPAPVTGQPSAELGDSITIDYTGGTNLTSNYAYSLLIAEAGNDTTCSPEGRAANLLGRDPAVRDGTGRPGDQRLIQRHAHHPAHRSVGLVQVCAASKAYDASLPSSDADYCNGFSPTTRDVDCLQAEETGLPRRGQNSTEFILY